MMVMPMTPVLGFMVDTGICMYDGSMEKKWRLNVGNTIVTHCFSSLCTVDIVAQWIK
jgi:hypothetical protein